jgi:hypothetical protein
VRNVQNKNLIVAHCNKLLADLIGQRLPRTCLGCEMRVRIPSTPKRIIFLGSSALDISYFKRSLLFLSFLATNAESYGFNTS